MAELEVNTESNCDERREGNGRDEEDEGDKRGHSPECARTGMARAEISSRAPALACGGIMARNETMGGSAEGCNHGQWWRVIKRGSRGVKRALLNVIVSTDISTSLSECFKHASSAVSMLRRFA